MDLRVPVAAFAIVFLLPWSAAQAPFPPDLGAAGQVANDVAGAVVPPALAAVYNATGQNLTREDIRITVDVNFTKGDVNLFGFLVGSGRAEVQARIHARLEMRVLSADRIRALIEGENGFNVSAENATFLTEVYLPADLFRASLTTEVAAAFQKSEEAALADYLTRTVPEMDVLALELAWENIHPFEIFTDTDLAEPPIVVELDLVVQYIRIESVRSLLSGYLESKRSETAEDRGKDEYVERLKAENGDPLRSRDFFAAAAYTQLLNLSMQPGWSLDLDLRVPQGYSFTYTNSEVEKEDERHIALHVDALDADAEKQEVFLASITHKRAVALTLFGALWAVGLVVAFPFRFLYIRRRLERP